jgi:hypothetical protein
VGPGRLPNRPGAWIRLLEACYPIGWDRVDVRRVLMAPSMSSDPLGFRGIIVFERRGSKTNSFTVAVPGLRDDNRHLAGLWRCSVYGADLSSAEMGYVPVHGWSRQQIGPAGQVSSEPRDQWRRRPLRKPPVFMSVKV